MGIKQNLLNKMLKGWEKKDRKILSGQTFPDGIEEIADIAYVGDGHPGHLLDVCYPKDAREKLPVIIDIHGGGFVYGDKSMNKLYCGHLAKRGYVVFNINYRLGLYDAKLPGQIQDVVAAVNWIDSHLDFYPADREKVFITGESAGGVLAVMAALIADSERLRALFGTEKVCLGIKAAAVVCGMMNVEENRFGYRGIRSLCLEKGYRKKEYYQNLIFDRLPEIKDLIPVFLTTSDEDLLRHMTFNFEQTLKKNRVDYQMKYFRKRKGKRLGHIFSVLHPDYQESAELMDEMSKFFLKKASFRPRTGFGQA